MAQRTLYFASIFIAYMIGIWTFTLVPKILIMGGLTGLLLILTFSGIISGIVALEIYEIKNRPYRIHEFMTKFVKTPSISIILLSFLFIVTSITAHYTGMSIESMVNTPIPGVGILVIFLGMLLLVLTRSRSLDIIVVSSVLTVVLIITGMLFLRNQAESIVNTQLSRSFISNVFTAVKSFNINISLLEVEYAFIISVLIFGLGMGFYYIIGGPLATLKVDVRKVIIVTILIQVIISFVAVATLAYSVGIAHQAFRDAFMKGKAKEALEVYREYFNPLWEEYRRSEGFNPKVAIESLYNIPNMLRDLKMKGSLGIIVSLMGSIFLAGFTTVLVLLEIGGQLIMDIFQVNRRTGITIVALLSSLFAGFAYLNPLRVILLSTVISIMPLIGFIEFYPVMKLRSSLISYVLGSILLIFGIADIVAILQFKNYYYELGVIVGLMLLIPLAFNKLLIKPTTKS
ncbi:sodium-dependent transporter [Pyrococcus horikoshii]|nr:sodium-dependent transporter [Pyrococcus horikoshii]HII60383.1 hypothetical protein [Pyrococcus horikoshii]